MDMSRGLIMNEKVKKAGAYGTLSAMAMGLLYNAYGQVKLNQIEIARIQEREKSTKELIIEVRDHVEFIRRRVEGLK